MPALAVPNDFSSGTTINSSQVNANFTQVETIVNGSLSDDNFSSAAGMYTAYRTILDAQSASSTDLVAGTYPLIVGGGVITSTTPGNPHCFYLDDADYSISGRTTRLRVRATVVANGTAPGINFTFGLYPIASAAGGADTLTYTLGSVIAGSTAAVNTPAANGGTTTTGSDFAVPADALYALGVVTSGTLANNSAPRFHVVLQERWT